MKTKFAKFTDDFPKDWMKFSGAGDAWLESYHLLEGQRDRATWSIFYVVPTIVALALELFVKALAAHDDATFDAKKKFGHKTSKIILAYGDSIPLFDKFSKDADLMEIVREYEKTVDVKYGWMGVMLDGDERQKIVNAIYEIREEMHKRTKVNYLR